MTITKIDTPQGRYYQTPIGLLPAVNTILDATTPSAEFERLENWRQKNKNHEQIRQQSADRGTALHELAAEFLTTGEEPNWIDPKLDPYWRSLRPYLEGVSRTAQICHPLYGNHLTSCSELSIYHPTLGYAGTLDWLGEINPLELTLTDFKSSRWYKKAEYTDKHRLQAAAYRMAVEALFGLEVDFTDIVIAIPKYPCQRIRIPPEEMAEDNKNWLERLEQFQSMQQEVAV